MIYQNNKEYFCQVKLAGCNPILYLHEYKYIADEIALWKNDEDLHPYSLYNHYPLMEDDPDENIGNMPERLCVGIGTYKTQRDGEIYLCILIEPVTKKVEAYSLGVYRSAELVTKAVDNLFELYGAPSAPVIIRSSQNYIYKTNEYHKCMADYPVILEMTEKGSRGGVAAVSTFFSQLMRKKGTYSFVTWQDAVDWLSSYIFTHNIK